MDLYFLIEQFTHNNFNCQVEASNFCFIFVVQVNKEKDWTIDCRMAVSNNHIIIAFVSSNV